MPSMLQDTIDSIFEGGTHHQGPLRILRVSLSALLATLLALLAATRNLHVLALLVIAAGLFASMEWFIGEATKVEAENTVRRKKEEEDKTQ